MKSYDLIIIGGGPGGLFSGITVGESGARVLILEKNSKVGKKLLVAGQGKCNVTNNGELKSFFNKYGNKGKYLKNSLNTFKPKDLINWFEKKGLPLVLVEETGKYFPKTMKSIDVVNLLEKECLKNSVDILNNAIIQELKVESDGKFSIKVNNENYNSKFLLISTGGCSYPGTGTTGDGYRYAKSLGHKIVNPKPCLTPVYVDNYQFAELSGISFKSVDIKLFRENKLVEKGNGDILLTHHNLSGPGIIDFSRYIEKDDILKLNLIKKDHDQFENEFLENINTNGKKLLKTFLNEQYLPERFLKKFCLLNKIDETKKISEISKKEREIIVSLSDYPFRVTRLGNFEIAMATTGGVSTEEINSKTMESKIKENLYFAGEVLDVDGDTGGYNIQVAFSTGYTGAQNIIKKLNLKP
ncbi:MAG: NAD(P)/FAD-dependent oxidoreductase [Fusobacteriaceae bacterium]